MLEKFTLPLDLVWEGTKKQTLADPALVQLSFADGQSSKSLRKQRESNQLWNWRLPNRVNFAPKEHWALDAIQDSTLYLRTNTLTCPCWIITTVSPLPVPYPSQSTCTLCQYHSLRHSRHELTVWRPSFMFPVKPNECATHLLFPQLHTNIISHDKPYPVFMIQEKFLPKINRFPHLKQEQTTAYGPLARSCK